MEALPPIGVVVSLPPLSLQPTDASATSVSGSAAQEPENDRMT
jgi:hypothetical protein